MNNATQVKTLVDSLTAKSSKKTDAIIKIAEACMGWPYVWGGYGQYCTTSNRKSYANRSTIGAAEAQQIIKRCQVLSGSKGSCSGCKYLPGGYVVRFFDCRGFTRWVLQQIGVSLLGAGATSQWNNDSNWTKKGPISEMPKNQICCVFMQNQKDKKTMEHTGFHVGDSVIIHCSGEVKKGKTTDKGWTHYAVPKGIDGKLKAQTTTTSTTPTLKKGSKGEYVTLLQTKLLMLGYDLGKYGADGDFGSKTLEAVKKFQADHGLTVDGVVGSSTWKELEKGATGETLYTVKIPHLKKTEADSLTAKYSSAICEKE